MMIICSRSPLFLALFFVSQQDTAHDSVATDGCVCFCVIVTRHDRESTTGCQSMATAAVSISHAGPAKL
jgi:hypothetical protein